MSKDTKKIINKFNDFFINIGPNLASTIPAVSKKPTDYLTSRNMNSMALKLTDKYEIDQTIKNLKNNTSPGSYEIPVSILKFAAGFIAVPLAELINASFSTGIFPTKLKETKVIPIFKAGDSTLVNNYRPISILNSFSKIFKKIIAMRLLNFLNKNEIFHPEQFGFREAHSNSSALIELNEFITQAINNNEIPISIFIDLKKAFDSLNHEILLTKLEYLGIRDTALELLTNYLFKSITSCLLQ